MNKEKNYYEILELDENASREEIEKAYRELLEMYGANSQSTYSLFDEDEREKLLKDLNEAYEALARTKLRVVHRPVDSQEEEKRPLEIVREEPNDVAAGPPQIAVFQKKEIKIAESTQGLNQKISEEKLVISDLKPEDSSGTLLKKLRETTGLSIKDVSDRIRVNPQTLEAIEEENYLKLPPRTYAFGFVKLYYRLFLEDFEPFAQNYIFKYDSFVSDKESGRR